jgi:hypothetical protein
MTVMDFLLVVKFLLVMTVIFFGALSKPKLYSGQFMLMYPISIMLIGSIVNYISCNLRAEGLLVNLLTGELCMDFLRFLGLIPFVAVFAILNLFFGLLDGVIFHFILNLSLNESFAIIGFLNIALHATETYQSFPPGESRDFSIFMKGFNDGLLCASERAITHAAGIFIFYSII